MIPSFLTQFGGEVDMSEAAEPLESFKTFNEFFFRKLKPSARPIANPDHPDVLVSSADCRLMAYTSIDDATRCWIKVCALCDPVVCLLLERTGCHRCAQLWWLGLTLAGSR